MQQYFTSTDLRSVVKRNVLLEGEYQLTENFVRIRNFRLESSNVKGLLVAVPELLLTKNDHYLINVVVNPLLDSVAQLSYPQIIPPNTGLPSIFVRPVTKKDDWPEIDYLYDLYVQKTRFRHMKNDYRNLASAIDPQES